MNSVEEAFGIFVEAAEASRVAYAIVGGIAVGVWGRPRTTRDVDGWCAVEGENLERLLNALAARGIFAESVDCRTQMRELGYCRIPHRDTYLDVFDAAGPLGDSILARRRRMVVEGRECWFASPEDLILLKALSDRAKDHDDLSGIYAAQGGALDRDYISRWTRRLADDADTPEILDRIRHAEATDRAESS